MNQEERFKRVIFSYGEHIKGGRLTDSEKKRIVEHFNKSNKSKSIDKVKEAVWEVVNEVNHFKLMEHTAATLDNIDDLLTQLKIEADKWDNK